MSKGPKPKRCVACGRPAEFALENMATGHQTPVCRSHQRLAAAGSATPGFEFVKLGGQECPTPAKPAGDERQIKTPAAGIVSGAGAG